MTTPNFAAANTTFGLNLLRQAHSAAKGKPVQVSPFSVRRALTMAAIGANGLTLDGFYDLFELPRGTDLIGVHRYNQQVLKGLQEVEARSKSPTTIETANALWLKLSTGGRYRFLPSFVDANKRWYDATVQDNLPFDDSTKDAINAWCDKATKGKISRIIEDLPRGSRAVLTDALYMKTPANKRFYKRNDTQGKFKQGDGTELDVTYMTNPNCEFNYHAGDGVQVLQFPFGQRGVFNYYLVLPDADATLDGTIAKLTGDKWTGMKSALVKGKGKFRIAPNEQEYSEDLKDVLADLGLGAAFTNAADFSLMCSDPLQIGGVNHKTYTKFTRKGFEGAAVTAVVMRESFCIPTTPLATFDITVDRPYIWLVEGRDEILFASTTLSPKEPGSFAAETDDEETSDLDF
ncbi:MAG: hypothetical protein K2W95_32115 [Candidatus Obscuribacterales bacterium]|nr:hypothetical protein [Candidatus Obscuribacterales bacterium]